MTAGLAVLAGIAGVLLALAVPVPVALALANDMPATSARREISLIWKSDARATSVSWYAPIMRCASCVGRNGFGSGASGAAADRSSFIFPARACK